MSTSNKPPVIGIAGTNGSGKDSAAQLLEKEFGYVSGSTSDLLRDEAVRRGLPKEREVLRTISNEWRQELGDGAMAIKVLEMKSPDNTSGVVVFSIRTPGEVDEIHKHGGIMIWLDADQRLRYERIRQANRGRSGEDEKTFEEFVREEEIEMQGGPEAKGLNVGAVKQKCDYFIENDASWDILRTSLQKIVKK